MLNASSLISYVIPLLPSFLLFFFLLVVFSLNGFKARFLWYSSPPLFSLFPAFLFSSLWVFFFFFFELIVVF